MVVVDDHFGIEQLPTVSTEILVNRMLSQLARHELYGLLFSDNEPQPTSEEFRQFSQKVGSEGRTSSPKDKAESEIQTAKYTITSAKDSIEGTYLVPPEQCDIPILAI
ncbi:hypothetical protein CRM22_007174 [Opisthorchis felineus]|uniref:Uncharacterized protein n=1 Tax=Opisthorchis felineus TaxID=147828 RepID=A0A4S2LHI1_OPIFE|nr:hypothetical protein CRM22_007174 [Opisthorchis felineus]